jgi:hypothetical protein
MDFILRQVVVQPVEQDSIFIGRSKGRAIFISKAYDAVPFPIGLLIVGNTVLQYNGCYRIASRPCLALLIALLLLVEYAFGMSLGLLYYT